VHFSLTRSAISSLLDTQRSRNHTQATDDYNDDYDYDDDDDDEDNCSRTCDATARIHLAAPWRRRLSCDVAVGDDVTLSRDVTITWCLAPPLSGHVAVAGYLYAVTLTTPRSIIRLQERAATVRFTLWVVQGMSVCLWCTWPLNFRFHPCTADGSQRQYLLKQLTLSMLALW